MAVNWRANVTATANGSTPPTLTQGNLTVPVGITNGAIIAFLFVSSSGAFTQIGVTCNGQAMTLINRYTITANQDYLEMWGFLQSHAGWATGAQSIVWTVNSWGVQAGNVILEAACFDGVNQTSIPAAFTNAATNTGALAANSVSVTTAAGNAVAAMFIGDPANANYTVAGGGTPGQNIVMADDALLGTGCEYQLISSGTSQNMTWTASTTGTWYGQGVNIAAVPTASTVFSDSGGRYEASLITRSGNERQRTVWWSRSWQTARSLSRPTARERLLIPASLRAPMGPSSNASV